MKTRLLTGRRRTAGCVLALPILLACAAPLAAQRPAITATSVSVVELEPGGLPVEIVVEGTALEAFTNAQVEFRGRALGGFDIEVSFDKVLGESRVAISAHASTGATQGELTLLSRGGRLPIPGVQVSVVVKEAPARISKMYVSQPTVRAGEALSISVTLDRPAGPDGAQILLTYPDGLIEGDQSIQVRPGDQEGRAQAQILSVSADEQTMIIGELGEDKVMVDLTVTAFVFVPVSISATALTMTGGRFNGFDKSIDALTMIGGRFAPVFISISPLTMTGVRGNR